MILEIVLLHKPSCKFYLLLKYFCGGTLNNINLYIQLCSLCALGLQ